MICYSENNLANKKNRLLKSWQKSLVLPAILENKMPLFQGLHTHVLVPIFMSKLSSDSHVTLKGYWEGKKEITHTSWASKLIHFTYVSFGMGLNTIVWWRVWYILFILYLEGSILSLYHSPIPTPPLPSCPLIEPPTMGTRRQWPSIS